MLPKPKKDNSIVVESLCPHTPWYRGIDSSSGLGLLYVLLWIILFSVLVISGFLQEPILDLQLSIETEKIEKLLDATKMIHKLVATTVFTFVAIFGSIMYSNLRTRYKDVLIKSAQKYVLIPTLAVFFYIILLYFIWPLSVSDIGSGNGALLIVLDFGVTTSLIGYILLSLSSLISISLSDVVKGNNLQNSLKKHLRKSDVDGVLKELHIGFRALALAINDEQYHDDIYSISCTLANALHATNSEGLWKNIWEYKSMLTIKYDIEPQLQISYSPWDSLEYFVLENLFDRYLKMYIVHPVKDKTVQESTNIEILVPSFSPFLLALSNVAVDNYLYLFKSYSRFLENILSLKDLSASKEAKELMVSILSVSISKTVISLEDLEGSPQDQKRIISFYNNSFPDHVDSIRDILEKRPGSLPKIVEVVLRLYSEKYFQDQDLKVITGFLSKWPQILVHFESIDQLLDVYKEQPDVYQLAEGIILYILKRLNDSPCESSAETLKRMEDILARLIPILEQQNFEIIMGEQFIMFINNKLKIHSSPIPISTEKHKKFIRRIFSTKSKKTN